MTKIRRQKPLKVKTPATQVAKASDQAPEMTAGSGQFSLFDSVQNEVDSASSRKNISSTAYHYQILMPGLGLDLFVQALFKTNSSCHSSAERSG